MITERLSNLHFWHLITPGTYVAPAILEILAEISRLTNSLPDTLVFTSQHGINLNNVADPIRRYIERNNVRRFARMPFVGEALTRVLVGRTTIDAGLLAELFNGCGIVSSSTVISNLRMLLSVRLSQRFTGRSFFLILRNLNKVYG